jgi:Restriction endonuclease/zinc-ribbon domain
MKFCPECGSQLPLEPAKFCPNCGKSLLSATESPVTFEEHKESGQSGQTAIYSLGVKLEQMVEQIMKNKGFSTEMRIKLRGESGATHEIDVLAKREKEVLAVECKNYGETRLVGIKEVRDFQSKIRDLPQINHALFVTNINFTSGVEEYANHNRIELWEGEKLKRDFYLLNLGRLDSKQVVEPIVEILDCALPIVTRYDEVAKLLLVNPHAVDTEATLDLHPYYLFTYQVEVKKGLLGRQKILEYGSCVVDATNRKIIQGIHSYAAYKNHDHSFFSKNENQNQEESEQILDEVEKSQIMEDLKKIQWTSQYKIEHSPKYAINKLECKLPANAAERMVLEEVVKEKRVQDDDVMIRKPSLIYVPKWLVNIKSKETNYRREVLPASETVIIDEIAFCPKEFSDKRRSSKKKTYAVCELCGYAYCSSHIVPIDDSYYCEKHTYRSSTKQTSIKRQESTNNVESSLSNINNSLDHSIDKALEKRL